MRPSRPVLRRSAVAQALSVVALSVVALLAGCGSSPEPGAGSGEAPDRLSPAAAVRAAPGVTQEAGSSRLVVTTTTDVGGQSIEQTIEGVFDPATRTGSTTLQLPQGGGTIEQRFIGDELYSTFPGQPGFFRFSLSELVGTELATASQPTDGLQALGGVSDDVAEVGTEEVRGEQTTHYRGTLDNRKALEQLGGVLGEAADAVLAGAPKTSPFDAWLDDAGRLRRFTTTLEIPASDATAGQAFTVTTTTELFDFGVDVSVQPPPADQVQDGAPLLAQLRGQTG